MKWWRVLSGCGARGYVHLLEWSRRRGPRTRQLDSVVTGWRRLPADGPNPIAVLGGTGRPVRRGSLTPRSALDDASWRRSVADAARKVLGPLEPIAWPQPPRNGVFDWGVRPPRVELRVDNKPLTDDNHVPYAPESKLSANSDNLVARESGPSPEDLQIYRRPRPESAARVPAEQGSAPTRLNRED